MGNADDVSDARAIWARLGPWYDAAVGEGNEFQVQLIMPFTTRLLGPRAGQRVLDVACGNGNYARRLAGEHGCRVTAFDVAPGLVDAARRRSATPPPSLPATFPPSSPPSSPVPSPVPTPSLPVTYHVADATDERAVLALAPPGTFDSAVCSMALMDLPTLDPLLRALSVLLKPGAPFVFSVPHPCFNSPHTRLTAELATTDDGRPRQTYSVTVSRYITPTASLSAGLTNQPEPHPIYHRPLSVLLSTFASHGFVLDGLEEPTFAGSPSGRNAFSWQARPEIPPALVARVRR